MKNIWILFFFLIVISCNNDDNKDTVYTVSFNANGGSPVPVSQNIEAGDKAIAPDVNPEKSGYVFVYWHLNNVATAYNFNTPVNNDITLYAKWQEEATAEYWQVTWDLNGGSWPSGSNYATQVLKGGTLAEPIAPVKEGSTFEGWYKEAALTNKVSFPYEASTVTANFTLYAKWETEGGGSIPTTSFTIRNTAEWNTAVKAIESGGDKSYTLVIEGTVSVPPTTGVEQGKLSTYTFGGGKDLSVTLTGDGTLALSGAGFLVCMAGITGDRPKLIIDGPTLQGRSDNGVPLLRLDYASLELKAGKITGNTNNGGGGSGSGGGVCIKRGSLTMSGGEISNNVCGQKSYVAYGGGAAITDGSFTMSGGTISGNTGGDGGGVYLYGFNFTMTGGTIKGNTSRSSGSRGGGVYYRKDTNVEGSFTKTGGIIYGSDAAVADRNKVVNNWDNSECNDKGAAVYYLLGFLVSDSSTKRRETTLGENDNISTESTVGWGI